MLTLIAEDGTSYQVIGTASSIEEARELANEYIEYATDFDVCPTDFAIWGRFNGRRITRQVLDGILESA